MTAGEPCAAGSSAGPGADPGPNASLATMAWLLETHQKKSLESETKEPVRKRVWEQQPGLGMTRETNTCQKHRDAGPGDLLKTGWGFLEGDRVVPMAPCGGL